MEFVLILLYIRNFSSVVGLLAALLGLARIQHWLGNRGTRRLKQFMWGVMSYHGVTIFVTAAQLVGALPVNQAVAVTLAYAIANVIMAVTTVLFSLYVLGIINGDPHDPDAPAHRPSHPLRRKDDLPPTTIIVPKS